MAHEPSLDQVTGTRISYQKLGSDSACSILSKFLVPDKSVTRMTSCAMGLIGTVCVLFTQDIMKYILQDK